MGKEQDLCDSILTLSHIGLLKGEPENILKAIDDYPEFFMNIGPVKGKDIVKKIQETKPKVMIELGGYVGYSAILFGKEVQKFHGKYYSLEASEEFADISRKLVKLAGLENTVKVIVSPAFKTLKNLTDILEQDGLEVGSARPVDFVFIDHQKDMYLPDFRVMESLNLIGVGTTIVADNISQEGTWDYHEYVNLSPQEKAEYGRLNDNIYGKKYMGRWNLLYENDLRQYKQDDWEDSVEYTYVKSYLNT